MMSIITDWKNLRGRSEITTAERRGKGTVVEGTKPLYDFMLATIGCEKEL